MGAKPSRYRPRIKVWEKTKVAARELRKEQTNAEALLWERLRKRALEGHRFRRQHPIDRFIVDFCCPSHRLVVELDGGIHLGQRERDRARERILDELGFRVVRFSNEQVLNETERVLAALLHELRQIETATEG
jgi:very-short-patch-repair endonuclease